MNLNALAPQTLLALAACVIIAQLGALALEVHGDARAGDAGAVHYRAAAILSGLLAACALGVYCTSFDAPVAFFSAVFFCLLILHTARAACKVRLGARLKRGGRPIQGLLHSAQQLHRARRALECFFPRYWLPFYQPWVLFREGAIARAELAAALGASAALVLLVASARSAVTFSLYACAAVWMLAAMGASLITGKAQMEQRGRTPADLCRLRKGFALFGLILCIQFIGMGMTVQRFFQQAQHETQAAAARDAAPLVPFVTENWHALALAAACCLLFFVIHLYYEQRRGRILRQQGVRRSRAHTVIDPQTPVQVRAHNQQLLHAFFPLLGGICAAFSFLFLPPHTARLEIFATAFFLLFYPLRKLAFFLVFQHLRPLWQDRRAWRTAYLRARASWLPEGVMALLAVAPFARFLAHRAAPDPLEVESVAANANLALCICLVLPLALRLGRRAMRR